MHSRRKPKRGIRVKYKLLFAIYSAITPLILVVSIYIYYVNYTSVVSRMEVLNTNLVQVADENIGYLNNDLIDMSIYIGVNNQVRNLLLMDKAEMEVIPLAWEKQAPMGFVRDTISVKSHIRTLILYPENGAAPFYVSGDMSVHNTDLEAIRKADFYTGAVDALGDPVYFLQKQGATEMFLNNKTDKIIIARMIFDLSKHTRMGFLCIGMDVAEYTKICAGILQNENEAVYLYGGGGMLLTHAGTENEDLRAYIEAQMADSRHAQSGYVEHDGNYVFYSPGDDGLAVYYVVPRVNITSQLSSVLLLPVILILAMMLLLVPLSMFASNVISRPLLRLHDSMEKFKNGDFEQQVEVASNDEIGELTNHFNEMVREIRELVDKNYVMVLNERQSELNALQAQINPHFLYNTLDSLFWQARNSGNVELSEDIYALSKLFRLVLSRGVEDIPVSREVELIGYYLHIQKMRFGKKLDFDIDVEEAIMNVTIPKLILQPFVENAIVHGLESTGEKGILTVTGRREGEAVRFTISDNGVGMSEEKLAELLAGGEDTSYASERVGHYAIFNVQQRLALKYETFTLNIESEQGEGTRVTIIVPG